MNYFLLGFLLVFSFESFSFDGSKCNEELFQRARKQTPEAGLLSTTVAVPVSTSQFISSTGSCSAIASKEIEKKQFIANNYEPLKIDMARGGGEFINTYANIAGCSSNVRNEYSRQLQLNLSQIYGEQLENSVEDIFKNIEGVVDKNNFLKNSCISLGEI